MSFEQAVQAAYGEAEHLLLRKHADYGPGNISGAPGGALNGLRVRMYDKFARLNNLLDNAKQPVNEPLRDTLLDLANYALIGLLVLDGDWPTATAAVPAEPPLTRNGPVGCHAPIDYSQPDPRMERAQQNGTSE